MRGFQTPLCWHWLSQTRVLVFPVGKNACDMLWTIICRCGRWVSLFCGWSVIEDESDGSMDEIHVSECTTWWKGNSHKSHTSEVTEYCLFWPSSSSRWAPQPCWSHCVNLLISLLPPFLHCPSSHYRLAYRCPPSPHYWLTYYRLWACRSQALQTWYHWKVWQMHLVDSCTDRFSSALPSPAAWLPSPIPSPAVPYFLDICTWIHHYSQFAPESCLCHQQLYIQLSKYLVDHLHNKEIRYIPETTTKFLVANCLSWPLFVVVASTAHPAINAASPNSSPFKLLGMYLDVGVSVWLTMVEYSTYLWLIPDVFCFCLDLVADMHFH